MEPKIEGITVVLLGAFNPSIFQPLWFGSEGILPKDSAENANVNVISNELTQWSVNWLQVQVLANKAQFTCAVPPRYEYFFDMISNVFKELRHSKVERFGLNYTAHYALANEDIWHKAGHALVPKNAWENVLDAPGLRQVSIAGKRNDDFTGSITITAEPSAQLRPGLFIRYNDDILVESKSAAQAVERISMRHRAFMDDAKIAFNKLLLNIGIED